MRATFLSICLLIGFGLTLGPAACVAAPARSDEGDAARGWNEQPQQADEESVARPVAADGIIPYVIVTDRPFLPEFHRLALAHSRAGLLATVRTVQSIHAAYPSGRDDAERIRMFLTDAHANWGTEWVLLGGDDPLVPVRRAFLRTRLNLGDVQLPTDQYYACLGGTWNADGDNLWGELPYPDLGEPGDGVDFAPVLSVGRAPVTTREEARVFVDKTLGELDAREAQEPLSVLLAASQSVFDFAQFTESLVPLVASDPAARVARLYQNWTQWPGSIEETRASLIESLDRGYDLVVLGGPGGPGIFAAGLEPQEDMAAGDLLDLTNRRSPSQIVAASAYTNKPGILSIGSALIRAPRGGAVTVLGCTDIQFIANGNFFVSEFFRQAYAGCCAPTIGEALKRAIVASGASFTVTDVSRLTTQGYMLLGDPALALPGTRVVAAQAPRGIARDAAGETGTGAASLALGGAYPNPTSTEARLEFVIPPVTAGACLEVAVLDVAGRLVRVLERGVARPGPGSVTWDLQDETGTRVRQGLYFMRVAAGLEVRVTRIAVLL